MYIKHEKKFDGEMEHIIYLDSTELHELYRSLDAADCEGLLSSGDLFMYLHGYFANRKGD